jgi:hypothetical protein
MAALREKAKLTTTLSLNTMGWKQILHDSERGRLTLLVRVCLHIQDSLRSMCGFQRKTTDKTQYLLVLPN